MNKVIGHITKRYEDYTNTVAPARAAWDWFHAPDGNVHVFDDTLLPTHVNFAGKKVAMIAEVPTIYDNARGHNPNMFHPYDWIKNNHQHFDCIMSPFTFLKDIVGDKYVWVPCQDCFISREDFGLYEKERLLSAIASFKNWTPGHRMRHEIIQSFHQSKLEVYGSGYNDHINKHGPFGKVIALAPYAFTIVVPNTKIDDFFSEQLTDAMAVGTIPIYHGTDGVKKHFNMDGIIQFETLDELNSIVNGLSMDLYKSKEAAVLDNYQRARQYTGTIDWLYNNKKDFLDNL